MGYRSLGTSNTSELAKTDEQKQRLFDCVKKAVEES